MDYWLPFNEFNAGRFNSYNGVCLIEDEEEDYKDDINIKNKIPNKNSFYKENSVKSVINFKTINLNSKNKKNRIYKCDKQIKINKWTNNCKI